MFFLIIKPLEIPLTLLRTEALVRRLHPTYPKKMEINQKARALRTGYKGELSLEFPLSFLPYEQYLIIHNLRIRDSSGFFQIDTLLLSHHFILIIEVKNIYGDITFDEMGQTIRKADEKEEGFTNPIDQVNLQHLRLLRWMRQYHFPPIPLEKIVVYSNTNTILRNTSNNPTVIEMVMHKEKLLAKIDELSAKYCTPCLTEEQLLELSNQLLLADNPQKVDVMKQYLIAYKDLIKGVICLTCSSAPMTYKGGIWRCETCYYASKTAHKQGLVDYALLVKNYINNREAREFLQLNSESIARKLLQKEGYCKIGRKSGMKYKLNTEI